MTDCPALIRAFPTLARSNPNDCCQPILGVVCNSAGRITELRVANAVRAGGATMGDLSSLTELTVLDLSNNQFTGAIPGWIYQLTKLTNLRLGANRLTGSLSSSIGNLLELQELNVFSNQLSGPLPASLNRLTQMSLLILSANSFSGNVPNLSNLRSLASLQLPDNRSLGGVFPLTGTFPTLATLSISNTAIMGLFPNDFRADGMIVLGLADTNMAGPPPARFASKSINIGNSCFEDIDPVFSGPNTAQRSDADCAQWREAARPGSPPPPQNPSPNPDNPSNPPSPSVPTNPNDPSISTRDTVSTDPASRSTEGPTSMNTGIPSLPFQFTSLLGPANGPGAWTDGETSTLIPTNPGGGPVTAVGSPSSGPSGMPSSLAVTVAVPIVVIAILGSLVALVIVRRRRRKYMENHDTVSPPNGVPFIPHQGGTGSQRVNNVPSTHTQSKGIFMFPDAIPSSHEKTPPSIPVTMFEKKQPPLVHTRTTVYPPPTYSKEEEAKRQAMESTSSASTITSLVVPPREGSSSATVPHRDLRVSDVSQWTIGDVAEWLVGAGLGQLVGPFQEHCIDGDKFLMLSEEGLLGMGILNADMRAVVLFAVSRVRGDGREEPPEYS